MKIEEVLEAVREGTMSIADAKKELEAPLDYATIDFDREARTGSPEVIYGEGKTAEQIAGIIAHMKERRVQNILCTRVDATKAAYLSERFPEFSYDATGRTFLLNDAPMALNKGTIAIICAGTSDLPVAREAYVTAHYLGNEVQLIADVGVAGIHRLFKRLDAIRQANVVIVIAGMEGALASVVGGLVEKPVIAVPTSIGYGANFHGLSALLAMLNSCASGVSVVNIDNGYGAGYMAHIINSIGGKR